MWESRKKLVIVLIAAVVLVLASVIGLMVYVNSPAQQLKKQLSLGERYLSELKYDEAILAFEKAIEIEPRTEEAYIGLANAYIGKEDYESALKAVEDGIAAVGETEELLALKAELEERLAPEEEPEAAELETSADKPERQIDVDWTFDLYDLWKYELFGKDISEWTVDELGQYLIDNGFLNRQEDDGRWSDFQEGGADYSFLYYPSKLVNMMGGEIYVYLVPNWRGVNNGSFSPSIEALQVHKHYNFPPLSHTNKNDFINRLPEGMKDIKNSGHQIGTFNGNSDYYINFNNGNLNYFHFFQSIWSVTYEDEISPEKELERFIFNLDTGISYTISFDIDTGECTDIEINYQPALSPVPIG